MKRKLTLLVSTLLFTACSHTGNHLDSLPSPKKVEMDSIEVPPVLLSVTRMFLSGDRLVAYQERNDTLFSFWKLPDCKFLYAAGVRGEGPNEFLMLDRNFQEKPNGFSSFEIQANRIKEVEALDDGTFRITSCRSVNTDLQPLNRLLMLADSSFCFVSDNEEYEFTLLKKDGITHDFGNYPLRLLQEEADTPHRFTYNKLTVAHPDGSRFAVFYAYVGLVRIYGADGTLQAESVLSEKKTVSGEERTVYYRSFPYATSRSVYVLTQEADMTLLEQWSWKGELEKRYVLPVAVSSFVVSESNNRMYAVSPEREDRIYTYRLD